MCDALMVRARLAPLAFGAGPRPGGIADLPAPAILAKMVGRRKRLAEEIYQNRRHVSMAGV